MVHAYADTRRRPSPAGLTAALGLSGVMVGALFFAAPAIETITYIPLIGRSVPEEVPPPVNDPPPQPERAAPDRVVAPVPVLPIPVPDRGPVIELTRDPPPPTGGTLGGTGSVTRVIEPPAPPAPVLTAAEIDPRFAADFQPDYPSAMIRRELEARVVVRVLVGTDGRVKAVEAVNAVDPAFIAATRRHALARWRFRPATRDGVAIEQWRQMAVRFELNR